MVVCRITPTKMITKDLLLGCIMTREGKIKIVDFWVLQNYLRDIINENLKFIICIIYNTLRLPKGFGYGLVISLYIHTPIHNLFIKI
jgi:hypothetical protein